VQYFSLPDQTYAKNIRHYNHSILLDYHRILFALAVVDDLLLGVYKKAKAGQISIILSVLKSPHETL